MIADDSGRGHTDWGAKPCTNLVAVHSPLLFPPLGNNVGGEFAVPVWDGVNEGNLMLVPDGLPV
jgi:hypothetical protein